MHYFSITNNKTAEQITWECFPVKSNVACKNLTYIGKKLIYDVYACAPSNIGSDRKYTKKLRTMPEIGLTNASSSPFVTLLILLPPPPPTRRWFPGIIYNAILLRSGETRIDNIERVWEGDGILCFFYRSLNICKILCFMFRTSRIGKWRG